MIVTVNVQTALLITGVEDYIYEFFWTVEFGAIGRASSVGRHRSVVYHSGVQKHQGYGLVIVKTYQ